MSLASLSQEVLTIVVDSLRHEHHSFVVPLAQTYNEITYAACDECLTYCRSIPRMQRITCDQFLVDREPNSPIDHPSLDVSFLSLYGTSSWLDDLARDLHNERYVNGHFEGQTGFNADSDNDQDTYAQRVTQTYQPYRQALDNLTLQIEAPGYQFPGSFVKFCGRFHYHEDLFPSLIDYDTPSKPMLLKSHPRKGNTG